MSAGIAKFQLNLMGPFRLIAPDGQRIDISSKKGQALIAMLSVAGGGERTRSWLQTQLWGSRGADQAKASLRSELSGLRTRVNTGHTLLKSDHNRLWLNLSLIDVDARGVHAAHPGVFLEGLDIAGEEGFEDWLRTERARQEKDKGEAALALKPAVAAPNAAPGKLPAVATGTHADPVHLNGFASLPAIAIIPITNQTSDANFDFVADGIGEDLIDRLSRLRWLPVIARSSSFAVNDTGTSPLQSGSMLGARYVVSGSLRKGVGGETLSLSVTDIELGRIIWSNRMLMASDVTSAAMEDLLNNITASLGTQIDVAEQNRALTKQQSDLNVRDLIWRGRWHSSRLTKKDSSLAKQLFAQALAAEPNSPEALIQSILAGLWEVWAERRSSADTQTLRRMAQRAIIADLDDARGHMVAGIAEMWLKQPIRAEAFLRHAISLNPSLVLAYAQLGSVLYLRGDPEAAIEPLTIAVRLSPNDTTLFYTQGELAMAHLMMGDFDRAVDFADKAVMRRSAYWYGHVVKINALARSGRADRAKAAVEELRTSTSHFKTDFINWLPFIDTKWNEYLKEGLNLAEG